MVISEQRFGEFVTENRKRWMGWARSYTTDDAEDIVQEAVCRAWRRLEQCQGTDEKKLRSWMDMIIRRLILDRHRKPLEKYEHVPMWDEGCFTTPKFSAETATISVLFDQIWKLLQSPCITAIERAAVESAMHRYEGCVSGATKQARYHGILKLRRLIAGEADEDVVRRRYERKKVAA